MGEWDGDRLWGMMVDRGIGIAALVARIRELIPSCRISRQHVHAWLMGRRPNADYLAAMAWALGVSIDELMGVESGAQEDSDA